MKKFEELSVIVAPYIIIFLICLVVLPKDEPIECYRCGDDIPPEYIITDFEQEYVCPSCMNKQKEKIRSREYKFCVACNEYLESSHLNEYGLCEYCEDKYICECVVCGEPGVCISSCPEYFLCEACTHKAIQILEAPEDAEK